MIFLKYPSNSVIYEATRYDPQLHLSYINRSIYTMMSPGEECILFSYSIHTGS